MSDDPSLDPRGTDHHLTTADGPLAVAGRGEGVGIPAGPSNPAARYLLGEEIARGGMGIISRATDAVLSREVAVKVLQDKYAPDSDTARRFADEARITGQLQHPNIPAVHDLGVLPDGRPFLAMKLIRGETLEGMLKRRADPAAGRGRFVAAFEQVCQAVAYAHAHGVIHRDLKPANVMVGAFGEVQVMDWGLAKVLGARPAERTNPEETMAATAVISLRDSDDLYTRAGSVLGTPAFMAPEQAAGAVGVIDRRSDVFGLGAVLAVMLTDRPPFVADTSEAARVKAAQGDVGECYARLDASGADPDLVALCKRCLAPRPEDRPNDAGEVAKAVAALRAAADERARRAELDRVRAEGEARDAQARAAEQRQRRRLLVRAAGAIALVLLAGLGVSVWQMRRAMQAEARAKTNARQAGLNAEEAQRNANQARLNAEEAKRHAKESRDERDAKGRALTAEQQARRDETKARQQAFIALRSMTMDVVEKKFTQGTALTDEDRMFLRFVIAQFDAFAASKGDDADSRALRAEGRFRVGVIHTQLGELKAAVRDYDEALGIRKQLAADFPSRPEFPEALSQTHNNRGSVLQSMGRPKEAEQDYDQALRIDKQLAADFPSRPEFRQQLAVSHHNRGVLLWSTGRPREAEQEYDQAIGTYQQLAAEFSSRSEFREQLALIHNSRGALRHLAGRPREAEQDYDQALRGYQQLVNEFPSRPDFRQGLARNYGNRGVLLWSTGRPREAEQDLGQALRIDKQLAADFPSRPEFRQQLALIHNSRGALLSRTGRPREAEQDLGQALRIFQQLAADFPSRPDLHSGLAGTCVNLAILNRHQGNWAAAKRLLLEGRPHHLAALKANRWDPQYRQFYCNHLNVLTTVHAGLLDQEDAVRTAETCRDLGWDAPADAYTAARGLSLSVPIVARHDKLNDRQRKQAVQFYGDAAMKLLRDAVSKGFKDAPHMKKDPDLAPLREREDFQKLVAELERNGK
jgi:tetratricopeptide (TPR) repeat protein